MTMKWKVMDKPVIIREIREIREIRDFNELC